MSANPNDVQAQLDELNRRRQIAQSMQQQNAQPQAQQAVNGRVLDQGFAPAIRAIASLLSGRRANQLGQQAQDVQANSNFDTQRAISDYQNADDKAAALPALQARTQSPGATAQQLVAQAMTPRTPTILKEGETAFDPVSRSPIAGMSVPKTEKLSLQRTDSGLTFNPASGEYKDSSGQLLSTDEIAEREAKLAANKSSMTSAATQKAKLAALPKGSMDAMVESYMQTGTMPTGISRNPAMTAAFWQGVSDRAAKDGNTVAVQMAQTRMRGALKPAMEQTQKQLAANTNFLGTLDKNITAADEFAKAIGGDGSPALNSVFLKWQRGVTGDPMVAKLDVLNNSIVSEAAKIASGGVGSVSASSDTQIEHQRQLMSSAQNYKQWRAAADAMLLEGKNRIQSIEEQRDSLTSQSGNTGGPASPHPNDIQSLLDKYK